MFSIGEKMKRDSRYEIVRIVAAIFITINHIPVSANATQMNSIIQSFFFCGGQFGVSLFVILGSWFLIDQRFKVERIVRICVQTVFYSLFLDIFCLLLGYKFTLHSFFRSFSYWYPFGYIFLLLVAPFLSSIRSSYINKIIILGGGTDSW